MMKPRWLLLLLLLGQARLLNERLTASSWARLPHFSSPQTPFSKPAPSFYGKVMDRMGIVSLYHRQVL